MQRGSYIKRGRGKAPNAVEKRHMDYVASQGCIVCGNPATVHHVSATIDGGRITRSHKLVVGLCPPHHFKQHDPLNRMPISVEALGHRGFFQEHGIDLLAEAQRLWDESEMREAA